MKNLSIVVLFCSLFFIGCNSEPTLQKYYVEKAETKDFIALDIPSKMLNLNKQDLTAEELSVLNSFEKLNILAFRVTNKNVKEFEKENIKLKEILKDEKYNSLIKIGNNKNGANIFVVGDKDKADEFVIYGNQEESGFAVVRVLGKDMDPSQLLTIISILQKLDINTEQLKPLEDLFKLY